MQISIHPPVGTQFGPDDYPEIMDFEPKIRELYEAVTEGAEVLSGSSSKVSTSKSTTNTINVEAKAGYTIIPKVLTTEVKAGYTHQTIDNRMTDTSTEAKETLQYTTNFSQLYQLFNGYHIGTNRAVFVVAPRPHTASTSEQTDFNLLDGERKLEGIQDVFLVVQVPKRLGGFCIQASIDTGHQVMATNTSLKMARRDEQDPDDPLPPHPPEDPTPLGDSAAQLIVTRRVVQNCGTFDQNGNFVVVGVPQFKHPNISVVWEDVLYEEMTRSFAQSRISSFDMTKKARVELANELNNYQRRFIKSMICGFSAGTYEPTTPLKSKTFRRLVKLSIKKLNLPVSKLAELKYISQKEVAVLTKNRVTSVGDIFKQDIWKTGSPDVLGLRTKIIEKMSRWI
jgi:hypothetical protein